jgi:Amt family ammonium transporter
MTTSRLTRPVRKWSPALLALSLPLLSFADDASSKSLDTGNTAWMLVATVLVLFMTIPGLALFYGGLVRVKNVLSVLMQCFAITCLISILWFAIGYSLAFSTFDNLNMNNFIGGLDNLFLSGVSKSSMHGSIPETVFCMFQMAFAIITPALVIGAFAERVKFSAVLLFSGLWSLIVYAPVCHWVWGGGWLAQRGTLDFAGGIVVHITAGVAALVCARVIGNRKGFPHTAMPPHNMTMTVTGAMMLWVGWFGFNAGSALTANGDAGMAMLATHLSAAAGSLAWMTMEWRKFGKPSVLGIVTGMIAGLGTITPASGYVGPAAAIVIGLLAGFVCFHATQYIKRTLKIDDSLDVFPVHGVGGILGTLATGVFLSSNIGIFSGQGYSAGMNMASQLEAQLAGVVVTILYSALATFLILQVVDVLTGLRVTQDEETEGLDVVLHDETGYNM